MSRKSLLGVVLFAVTFVCVTETEARGRRRARNNDYVNYGYSGYSNYGSTATFNGGPQAVAEAKVALLAARGYGHHPGGSFGGGVFEGWGQGSTPEAARYSTCNGDNCAYARGSATAWSPSAGVYFAINIW